MFETQCEAQQVRNRGRCTRRRTTLVWCFAFQGERYDGATWVSTCSHHASDASGIVSILPMPV